LPKCFVATEVVAPLKMSPASCRRLQAGSLCSPEVRARHADLALTI
jgi:hypothetical protein